ncbi:ABC transporter permease [Lacticaseibacillus baoqingensis]|uniref:ABC transporter permease n=1 Tax=Lacticaseibacillus baoqingensis TaxID=2486013 RepID=A0ABW4E7U7_9LACO|nr:ABC transporter permease [Lacticaseibacillus baoqingensis]
MILGALLLALTLAGWNAGLRVLGVDSHLAWLDSLLLQILVMYTFAMVNALTIGFWVVAGVGWLAFGLIVLAVMLGKLNFPFVGTHPFDLWMIAMGIVMGLALWRSPLIHYDNYTHWALIVKFMTATGRLPGAHDALITYTSYPPATGLFITYVAKFLGFHDGVLCLAQFILIWAAVYTIFGVLRDKTRGLMIFVLCFTISIANVFNIAIRMNNLLVDFVLPIVAVGGIAGAYCCRHHVKQQLAHVALVVASLLLIKNSGTFFVIALLLYLAYTRLQGPKAHRWRRRAQAVGVTALAGGLGYLPFLWWNWHVKTTFTLSKHEISTAAYSQQLAHESTAQILGIGRKLIASVASLDALSTRGIILINVVLAAAYLVIRLLCQQHNHLLALLAALDVGFILYDVSLFGMYVLAMPYNEAKQLDGLERYLSSVVIFALFLGAMGLVIAMDDALYERDFTQRDLRGFRSFATKNLYQVAAFVLVIFSVILMFSETNGIQYTNHMNKNALPLQLQRIGPQWTRLNHEKVAIVDPHAGDVADYYAGYVGRYYFFSDQVVGQENWNMSRQQFKQAVLAFDYVAIPEWHRTFSAMVKQVWGQKVKTGIFKVTPQGLQRVKGIPKVARQD